MNEEEEVKRCYEIGCCPKINSLITEDTERSYWIVVILSECWMTNQYLLKMMEKKYTQRILISKPCFNTVYNQYVRYAYFRFFKVVHLSYFGKNFYSLNDVIPVVNRWAWMKFKADEYISLICDLGSPDFSYMASNVKVMNYQLMRRNKRLKLW